MSRKQTTGPEWGKVQKQQKRYYALLMGAKRGITPPTMKVKGKQFSFNDHSIPSEGLGPKTVGTQLRATVTGKDVSTKCQLSGWKVTASRKITWGQGGKKRSVKNYASQYSQLPKLTRDQAGIKLNGRSSPTSKIDLPMLVSPTGSSTRLCSSTHPGDNSPYDGDRAFSSQMSKHESDTYHEKLIKKLRPTSKSYPGVADILAERSESWKKHSTYSTYTSGLPINPSSRSLKPQQDFNFTLTKPYGFSYFEDQDNLF